MGDLVQKIRPDMNIGRNIRNLRKRKSLTQNQVVAKMNLLGLNISLSTYAKIETNRINIRVSELVALSAILETGYDEFFIGLALSPV
jgi:transcriptional regulator with XRE-family HTH domain